MKLSTTFLAAAALLLLGVQANAADWFGPVIQTPQPYVLEKIAVGDLNRDGYDDLATLNFSGDLHIYLSAGDGTFTLFDARNGSYSTVAFGDVNGNGRSELLCTSGAIACAFEMGKDGELSNTPVTTPVPSEFVGITHGVARDLDDDGYDDFALCGSGGFGVLWGSANGLVAPGDYYAPLPPSDGCANSLSVSALAIGDVTGDGISDVVLAAKWGIVEECPPAKAAVRVARRIGPRVFQYDPLWISYFEGPVGCEYQDVDLGDIDGDGKRDLTATRSTGVTRVLRGLGNGLFVGAGADLTNPDAVLLQDVDEDGCADLLAGLYTRMWAYRGSSSFHFSLVQEFPSDGARFIESGRFDSAPGEDIVGIAGNVGVINVFPRISDPTASPDNPPALETALRASPSVLTGEGCTLLLRGVGGAAGDFRVFDAAGRLVAQVDGQLDGAGMLRGRWDARIDNEPAPSGTYFVRAGEEGPTIRVCVVR